MSNYVPTKWDCSDKDTEEYKEFAVMRDNIHIPIYISDEWIKTYFNVISKDLTFWHKIHDTVEKKIIEENRRRKKNGDTSRCETSAKAWIFDAIKHYKRIKHDITEQQSNNFLKCLREYTPKTYEATIVHDLNTADATSWLKINTPKLGHITSLSGMNLSDEDRGKIFVEVANKSDVADLVANQSIIDIKKKMYLHNAIVSTLIESVCGVHSYTPAEHNKYPETYLKDAERMVYKGDLKKLPKSFIINKSDLCCPPTNSWTKRAYTDIIKIGRSSIIESFKRCIESFTEDFDRCTNNRTQDILILKTINNGILPIKEYRIQQSENYKVSESKKKHGGAKIAHEMKCKFTLDDWQVEFLSLTKQGKSVLLQGATSGGKTFISMAAIDHLIHKYQNTETTIAYVAPNHPLSIQTNGTIRNSFRVSNISLVTKGIQDVATINKIGGLKVIVGTPKEIWTLMKMDPSMVINDLLIDEIHMIGNQDSSTMDKEAIVNIMSRCTRQIIGLSATIHSDDLIKLSKFMEENSHINDKVHVISYTERPVPLYYHMYNEDFVPINAINTKKLLIDIRTKNRTPTLIFDDNDAVCFSHYYELVQHLKQEEINNFPCWIEAMNHCMSVHKYNCEFSATFESFQKVYHYSKSDKMDRIASEVFKSNREKVNVLDTLIKDLEVLIIRALTREDVDETYVEYPTEEEYRLLSPFKAYVPLNKIKAKELKVNIDALQLLPIYQQYKKERSNICVTSKIGEMELSFISPISTVTNTVSPFLKLGKTDGAQDIIDVINARDGNKEDSKLRNTMIRMCTAERCKESDVRVLFELLAEGLRFGVGILIENTPQVVQLRVMSLLKSRSIEIVFSSRAMRMGIDYPIRSCVIRSDTVKAIDVCAIMQMGGRAGRRRKDPEGHVIFWNITNGMDATLDNLPKLELPSQDITKGGIYVSNSQCFVKIVSAVTSMENLNSTINDMFDVLINAPAGVSTKNKLDQYVDSEDETEEVDFSKELIEANARKTIAPIASTSTSDKKAKPVLTRRVRRERKRFRKDKDAEGMMSKNKATVDMFIQTFDILINVILKHMHPNPSDYLKERSKVTILKSTLKASLMEEPIKTNDIEALMDDVTKWSCIIQELYMINRKGHVQDTLQILAVMFETLHQTKYKLMMLQFNMIKR